MSQGHLDSVLFSATHQQQEKYLILIENNQELLQVAKKVLSQIEA